MTSAIRRTALFASALSLAFTLAACQGKKGGSYGTPPPVPVTLIELKKEILSERVSLLGESRSPSDGTVRAEVEGVVSQILADVGDQVEPGQELAKLDGVEQRIALAEATAQLARAQSELKELTNGTRPTVLRQREAERRASQARVQEASSQLEAAKALGPQRVKQAEGDYLAAKANEANAADEYRRTQDLVKNGALSGRELVRVQSAWDRARGELLRAQQARSVQQTTNQRDVANAQSALEMAKSDLARTNAVFTESQQGPRPEVISAQREVVAALKAARDRANLDYERTVIRASAKGTIKRRLTSVGSRLAVGDPVFELAGRDVEYYFEAPESVRGRVKVGQTVLLSDRSAMQELKAEVIGVAQAVNEDSQRQSIRVGAPDLETLPGSSVRGTLLIPVEGQHFTTHRDALVSKKGRWVVFTINDEKKAVEHNVDLIAGSGTEVAIFGESLKAGMMLVQRGAPALSPDAVVRLPEARPTPQVTPKT